MISGSFSHAPIIKNTYFKNVSNTVIYSKFNTCIKCDFLITGVYCVAKGDVDTLDAILFTLPIMVENGDQIKAKVKGITAF